jgi:transcriptional regulator with XRE-family HTH domain
MKGTEIKAEIVRNELTQREVARAMGIRHESLSRILRGEVSETDTQRIRDAMAKVAAERRQSA